MEKLYNELVLDSTKYTEEEFNKILGGLIRLLTKEQNCCFIKEEDCGLFVIQYNHDETIESWGTPSFSWLTAEEEGNLIDTRIEQTQYNDKVHKFYKDISEIVESNMAGKLSNEDYAASIQQMCQNILNDEEVESDD